MFYFTLECAVLLLFILYPRSHHANIFRNDLAKREVFVEQTNRTWKDASKFCNLYGSDWSRSYYVRAEDIPYQNTGDPEEIDNNLYWIGATVTFTPWFKILGCYVYTIISKDTTLYSFSALGPVAYCYQYCNSHFGVSETGCYCSRQLNEGRLNKSCDLAKSSKFQNDIIGVTTEDNFDLYYKIAVYKIQNGILDIKDNLDECLMKAITDFNTYPCDYKDSSNRTWTEAIIGGLTSNNGGPLQWTPFVRRRILRWYRGTYSTGTACVSVKKARSKEEYEIVLTSCDKKLPSICQTSTSFEKEEGINAGLIVIGIFTIALIVIGVVAAVSNEEERNQQNNNPRNVTSRNPTAIHNHRNVTSRNPMAIHNPRNVTSRNPTAIQENQSSNNGGAAASSNRSTDRQNECDLMVLGGNGDKENITLRPPSPDGML